MRDDSGSNSPLNPFEVTKAVDFSDAEIMSTFVDFDPGDGGFKALADPKASMPSMLVGGKGSGRTHLMRYYSAALQSLRHPGQAVSGVAADGYIGVYLRCTGLNAGRFAGKGIETGVWDDVFSYYMDLWLAQLCLRTLAEVLDGDLNTPPADELKVSAEVFALLDDFPGAPPDTLDGLRETLHGLQREIDFAVNNAAMKRSIDVAVRATRGQLPFQVPRIISTHLPELGNVHWLYLIDELENLTESQQRYVQTLLREREPPTSFMVGSQRAGIRTRSTYSAGVDNKEGSEYRQVDLDKVYLANYAAFKRFCSDLIAQRLVEFRFADGSRYKVSEQLHEYFAEPRQSRDGSEETMFANAAPERLALAKLRRELEQHQPPGAEDPDDRVFIISAVGCEKSALVEKLNILLLYRAWAKGAPLRTVAEGLQAEATAFISEDNPSASYVEAMSHWRGDLLAQLLVEYSQKQRYIGLDTFTRMAGGLPRNVVITLKNVYRWAMFNGEAAFGREAISEQSQREGVLESSNWFFRDALIIGRSGPDVQQAISRLADLFRALRFSDKPPEVSLTSFSVDSTTVSLRARSVVEEAANWSLLLEIPSGQKDRNSRAVVSKYQLNPMLCPRWDLPLVRRGAITLSAEEANAIFDSSESESYSRIKRARVRRATVPFGKCNEKAAAQGTLLDGLS
jgi:hypothetical protein